MIRYQVIVNEVVEATAARDASDIGALIERLKVTVDAAGPLDHAAILSAVGKTKRVYTKRTPKVST
jgi:hypothetical protein